MRTGNYVLPLFYFKYQEINECLIIEKKKQRRRKKWRKSVLLLEALSLSCKEKLSSKNRSTEYGGFLHLNTWPKLLSQNHSLYSDDHCLNQKKYFKVYIPIGIGSQFHSDLIWVRIEIWAWGRMWKKGSHSAESCETSQGPYWSLGSSLPLYHIYARELSPLPVQAFHSFPRCLMLVYC